MAWTCHLAMPSLARYVWPIAADSQACNGKDARKLLAPANSLAAFLSAGWPPVGFLYGEARFVMQKYKELHAGHIPPEGIQVVTMRDSHISR
jgi:hypothetical protein